MSRVVPWQLGTTWTWDWQGGVRKWEVPGMSQVVSWQLETTRTWDWQGGVR